MSKAESYACKRLNDQIKFFGAKPKRFVSIYAKKPRIRIKSGTVNKLDFEISDDQKRLMRESREAILRNLGGMGARGLAAQQAGMMHIPANQQALGLSNMTGMASALGQAQTQGLGRSSINGIGAFLPNSIFW